MCLNGPNTATPLLRKGWKQATQIKKKNTGGHWTVWNWTRLYYWCVCGNVSMASLQWNSSRFFQELWKSLQLQFGRRRIPPDCSSFQATLESSGHQIWHDNDMPPVGFGGTTLRPVIELRTLDFWSFLAPGWRWWHAGSRFDTWLSREWSGMLHHLPAGPRLEVVGSVCVVVSRFVGYCEVPYTVNRNCLRRLS